MGSITLVAVGHYNRGLIDLTEAVGMSDSETGQYGDGTEQIWLVEAVEHGYGQHSEVLRAFSTEQKAETWKKEYVKQFEWDKEKRAYHIGMGAYRKYPVHAIPLNDHSADTDTHRSDAE